MTVSRVALFALLALATLPSTGRAVPPVALAPPPRPTPDPARAVDGFLLFRKLQCVNCHSADTPGRAPRLEGLYGSKVKLKGGAEVLADEAYLEESIRAPRSKVVAGWEPIMPTYGPNHIGDQELVALVAYLKWIKVAGRKLPVVEQAPPDGRPTDPPRLESLRIPSGDPRAITRPQLPAGHGPEIHPEDLLPRDLRSDDAARMRNRLIERGFDPATIEAMFPRPIAPPPGAK